MSDYLEMPLIVNPPFANKADHFKSEADNTFRFRVKDDGIEDFLKGLGKISQVRSNKLIEFIIYNDAFSIRSDEKHYYAKFVEYGWTKPDGTYYPGKRLFRSLRKKILKKIKEELKKVPRIFIMKYIEQAFERAVQWTIKELESITPIWSGRMRQSWSYYKVKNGVEVKSKGDTLTTLGEIEEIHDQKYQIHPTRKIDFGGYPLTGYQSH